MNMYVILLYLYTELVWIHMYFIESEDVEVCHQESTLDSQNVVVLFFRYAARCCNANDDDDDLSHCDYVYWVIPTHPNIIVSSHAGCAPVKRIFSRRR